MSEEIQQLLTAKVDKLAVHLRGGQIITVDKNASLKEVLDVLRSNDIRSVPLSDNGDPVGLVDMVDIVTFVVKFVEENRAVPASHRNLQWFYSYLEEKGLHIQQIAGMIERNKYVPVASGASLDDVMQTMIANQIQRVPVINAERKLENFVTQSSLIQFFAANTAKLGKYSEYTLAELGFQPKKVFVVNETSLAYEAFQMMVNHHITGAPIVDSEGNIITNLSSKDMCNALMDPQFFEKFNLPIERFISDLKSKTFMHNAETMYPRICCKFSNKFVDVLLKLAATKIHRIYVVNASSLPIGVISQHDIVAKIWELSSKNEVPLSVQSAH